MDFEKVFIKLISTFKKNNIEYALIGGFALGIYGVIRATADLDFLINKKHKDFLKEFMIKNLYELTYESENIVQFEHPTKIFGSVDFLYAFRVPSLEMLKRAVKKKIFDGKITIKVLIPEDLIGLKIQSFVNNPKRKTFEMEDIKNLIAANQKNIKWDILEKYFVLFRLNSLYKQLRNEFSK
ncbi:MAG: nucleotidyltransferase [Candidatus Omnitrophica bacterium]|nr:nucleotidyltransferase [Candidatus Omnitrophota bacterium]MCM8832087.1 nucleotidyltransferase [Candidatus Omnitrophota bacterium]